MKTQTDITQEKETTPVQRVQQESSNGGTAQLVDNRVTTTVQRKLQATMSASTENNTNPIQQKTRPERSRRNNTGLPDNLKSGIENLSGYSMDDVKVHYNSSKPAQLQAHAYAQGADIHLGAGQEKHLPHEAWHVVQQKQGRVKPTMQFKGKVNINDDSRLEKEADVMGSRALKLNKEINFNILSVSSVDDKIIQRNEDSYASARNVAEDADLTDTTRFKAVTGSGVNKQVYEVIGTKWFVLVLSEKRKPNLEGEVKKLMNMQGKLPVADLGPCKDVNKAIFPVKMPSGWDFKKLCKDDTHVVVESNKIDGFGFLEMEIPGVGIEKKGTVFSMENIKKFIEEVRALILDASVNERENLLEQAISSLEEIEKFVEMSDEGIADFQLRYNKNTGNMIVMDPGRDEGMPHKLKQLKWLKYWITNLKEFKTSLGYR